MDLMETLRWLTDEEKQMFVQIEHVLESDGWRNYIQPWIEQRIVDAGVRGANAGSWDENRIAYGERMAFQAIQNLAETLLSPLAHAAEERQHRQHAMDEESYE